MFRIVVRPGAAAQIRRLRRVDAVNVLNAIERHLRLEPERVSRSRIKRLRGSVAATYRLRVGDYRVFYDVAEAEIIVIAVLHKRDTAEFYGERAR
jgi:mRNA-degrading endonuclease RelE of RelBE toxin-antitoxin system